MKLDNDPGNFHPSLPCKSYNPFDSDDDTLDSSGLKSENMHVKENCNNFDLKLFEKNSDTVIFHMDNGAFLWEEAMLGQPATSDHPVNANGKTSSFEKEGQLCTNKNVTECQLPEFIVCYKESTVKDIGIDEGVPSHKSAFLALSGKGNNDVEIRKISNQLGVHEAPKSKLDSEWQKVAVLHTSEHPVNEEALSGQYLVHEFGNDDMLKITELKLDLEVETTRGGLDCDAADCRSATEMKSDRNVCKAESDLIVKDGLNHDDTMEKKGKVENIAVAQESATKQSPSELSTEHGVEVISKELRSPNKEEILPNSEKHVTLQESAGTSDSNKLAYNSKVESTSITFDFNSSTNSEPGNQEDQLVSSEVAKPPTTQTMTRQEEGASRSSVPSRPEERVHGETSFSAGMPVSPPSSIMFPEPLTYSGNISLRSESSAGSARSFAFPVLQKEWDSSPARMGKANQRYFKKHRSWVQAINCCKF